MNFPLTWQRDCMYKRTKDQQFIKSLDFITNIKYLISNIRVAGVGWLSGTAAESLRAFGERVFANFCDKNIVFYNCGKTGHLWLAKRLAHTQARSLKHPF